MLLSLLLLAAAAASPPAVKEGVLAVGPKDSLPQVSQRLAKDASIREVVLAAGTYRGGWTIPALEGADPEAHPLLIRSADGAEVIFDGAKPVTEAKPVPGRPGVFEAPFESAGKSEPPKLWEPGARVRYLYAADVGAVQAFPGSYLLSGRTLLFHTSDGSGPHGGSVLASSQDFGLAVQRRFVTVRGLRFRNFTARSKWSAGVQMLADHVTVERCDVTNASFGFTIRSDDGALLDSTARDVGGGVYLEAKRGRVERSRFLKTRDRFAVPTYIQDDTGIQAYYPAESGTMRGNLTAGFGQGIIIKANPSPWVVEENTVIGADSKYGFVSTEWHPQSVFRRNVVSGYALPVQFAGKKSAAGVGANCYDLSAPVSGGAAGKEAAAPPADPGSIRADPGFVDRGAADFRLAPDSPCRAAAAEGETMGAGEIARSPERVDLRAGAPEAPAPRAAAAPGARAAAAPGASEAKEPRTWVVSPAGRDGAAGSGRAPLRSVQEAVDRAGPGDTILLQPGIYSEPVRFERGGLEGKPITLKGAERWKAVLDGARRLDELIRIEKAPFVVIQDLEIRWFRVAGIHVRSAADVRVEGCRIWNAHWGGNWPEGDGVFVEGSPRFSATRNVLYNQERGFDLQSSPGATLTRNTAVANLYGAVQLVRSVEGSTCIDNDFSWQGNDAIAIFEDEGGKELLASFTLDHNNYGLSLSGPREDASVESLVPRPRDKALAGFSKAVVYYEESPSPYRRFRSMAAWREFSGLDAHSIFADPLFVDATAGDFRLDAKSPDRGAGTDGSTLGAFPD